MQDTRVQFLGREDPLEKKIATHSGSLAWRIPWTEELGGIQSTGSQRIRHDWAICCCCCCSVAPSCLTLCNPMDCSTARLPYPSPSPGACSKACPLSWWCHPTISSSVIPFSSCLQSFPTPRSFLNESALCIRWPKYWIFSFNTSPCNEHPGLISFRMDWLDFLQSRGLSSVFSNTSDQKHQFADAQPSLSSNSLIHTWLLEKP